MDLLPSLLIDQPYPSDLTEAEWVLLKLLLLLAKTTSSPRVVEMKEVVNTLMSVADNSIKWQTLGLSFSQIAYSSFPNRSCAGIKEQIHQFLRRQVRLELGRDTVA